MTENNLKLALCAVFSLTWEQILSRSRKERCVYARIIYVYNLKKMFPEISLHGIAAKVNRDHATVHYMLAKYKDYYQYCPPFYVFANEVEYRAERQMKIKFN